MPLNDAELRPHIRKFLRLRYPSEIIADEIYLAGGKAIVDLIVLGEKTLRFFEIKGETDTMRRLESQTKKYQQVSKYCSIFVTKNHQDKIFNHVPEWWEIIVVSSDRDSYDGVNFEIVREGKINPNELVYEKIGMIMWKSEIVSVYEAYGHLPRKSWTKKKLVEGMKSFLPTAQDILNELVLTFRLRLEHDREWRETHLFTS